MVASVVEEGQGCSTSHIMFAPFFDGRHRCAAHTL